MAEKIIDVSRKPTKEQIEMLERAAQTPVVFDEDCPELTEEDLLKFRRVTRKAENDSQTITLQLSPQAIRKAQSFGKDYIKVLSRMLEKALSESETINHH